MQSIVFVHKGSAFYLPLSIKQAIKSNPNMDIILLGDATNSNIEGIRHFHLNRYFKRAQKFDLVFENFSPNNRDYELFCFQRWLVIWEFQQNHPEYRDRFLYCDTDTLLYDDVSKDLNQMGSHPLALETNVGPAFTFFNVGTLSEFCNVIENFYTTDKGKQYISNFIREKKKVNAIHGFSDMYAFEYYANEIRPDEVINAQLDSKGWNLTNVSNIGNLPYFRYDQNVNFKEQFELTKDGIKKFEFINGKPYSYNSVIGQNILFKGIHFQGKAKYEMLKLCNEPLALFSENWWQYNLIYKLKKIKSKIKKLLN